MFWNKKNNEEDYNVYENNSYIEEEQEKDEECEEDEVYEVIDYDMVSKSYDGVITIYKVVVLEPDSSYDRIMIVVNINDKKFRHLVTCTLEDRFIIKFVYKDFIKCDTDNIISFELED